MEVIRRVRDHGVAMLFVSHFLDQIYQISDRITVLRNGELVGEYLAHELPRLQLVSKMIGKDLAALEALEEGTKREAAERKEGGAFLLAKGLGRKGSIEPYDLEVHPVRCSGWPDCSARAGPNSSGCSTGRTATTPAPPPSPGAAIRLRSPRLALDRKIAFASENRRAEGLIGDLSVRANIVLAMQAERGWTRRSRVASRTRWPSGTSRPSTSGHESGDAGPQPVRWEPAESAAGQVVAHRAQSADPGRADQGHRRRREGADPEARRRPVGPGHGGHLHLGRTRGGPPPVASHRHSPGPPQGRRDRERRGTTVEDLMGIIAAEAQPA